ncbi:MAG: AsmA-like C-terminal region-containing protein [Thermosulfidibacteraceae bacterium]
MARRVYKYSALVFFGIVILFLMCIVFINDILNSSVVKKEINSILKSITGYDIHYKKINTDIINGKIVIEKLQIDGNDLQANINKIKLERERRENKMQVDDGLIYIKLIKPSEKRKEIPKNIETPFKKIVIKNLEVKVLTSNIYIDNAEFEDNKDFYIKAKIAGNDNLEANGSYDNYTLTLKLIDLKIDTKKLIELSKNINLKLPDITLFKNKNLVSIKNLDFIGNMKTSNFKISIKEIKISNEKGLAELNNKNNVANIDLIIDSNKIQIIGTIKQAELKNLYDLVLKIYYVDVIDKISKIVSNATLKNTNISIDIPLNTDFDVKKIYIDGYIENSEVNIPSTNLKCNVDGKILLKEGKLGTIITKGSLESLNLNGNFTMNILEKNLPFIADVNFYGSMDRLNSIFEKIDKIRELNNIIKVYSGNIEGKITVSNKETFSISINGIFRNVNTNINIIQSEIKLGKGIFNIKNSDIHIETSDISSNFMLFKSLELKSDGLTHIVSLNDGILRIEDFKKEKIYKDLIKNFKRKLEIDYGTIDIEKLNFTISNNNLTSISGDCILKDTKIEILDESIPTKTISIKSSNMAINYPKDIKIQKLKGISDNEQDFYINQIIFNLESDKLKIIGQTKYTRYIENIIAKYTKEEPPITPKKGDLVSVNLDIDVNKNLLSGNIDIESKDKKLTIKDMIIDNEIKGNVILECNDSRINGNVVYNKEKGEIEGTLKGIITGKCVNKAFTVKMEVPSFNYIKPDIFFKISTKEPYKFTANGTVDVNSLILDSNKIDFTTSYSGNTLEITSIFIESSYGNAGGFGKIERINDKFFADLFLQGKALDIDLILSKLRRKKETEKKVKLPAISATINFDFSNAKLFDRTFKNLNGNLTIKIDGNTTLSVLTKNTDLCGIKFNTNIYIEDSYQKLSIKGEGNGDLHKTITCLTRKPEKTITGTYGYVIDINVEGKSLDNFENSSGEIQFISEEGRIHKLTVIVKLLEILNLYKILSLQFGDLTKEGFEYNYLIVQAKLKSNKILIRDSYIDSDALKIWSEGKINLKDQTLNMTILAAPFSTFDKILAKLPIIGPVFLGKSKTLLSIPFRVSGNIDNPQITPLDPSLIGKGIFNLIKRIIKAPTYIFPTEE